MVERQGWRRGSKGRGGATAAGGKGWQSRRQPAAKKGASQHRNRLVALGALTVILLAVLVAYLWNMPRDMPLLVLGVTSCKSPIPPNAYVREDAERLAGTNTNNIKRMSVETDLADLDGLRRHLQDNLHPRGFVSQDIVTVYLSAHGVVDRDGKACLLLGQADPLDETSWLPISDLFELLTAERPDAVKVLLLDSGKIDENWSLGILHNSFPDAVREELRNHSKIFVITDRASGQLAWTAPERGGTIFGHFVASGLSAAADSDGQGEVSLLEFYGFVKRNVYEWVRDNRASDQTPLLLPEPTADQDITLVNAGDGPSESGSAKERVLKLKTDWRTRVLPLWTRYEEFAHEADLTRYDPLAVAAIEAGLLRAEQLLLAGGAYETEFNETLDDIRGWMSYDAKPALPSELRGFSLPLAAQLEQDFEPMTSGQDVLDDWLDAGGWPLDEEGQEKPHELSYLEAANVASRWLLESPGDPGGPQLREALRLIDNSGRHLDDQGARIEHVQEVQLLKLVSEHADVTDAENWPVALRAALRQTLLTQKMAEQIAAPDDGRVHYWVQSLLKPVDQRRRQALDKIFVGGAAWQAAREELARCQTTEAAAAQQRLDEVTRAYQLRDRVLARLTHVAMWLSQSGRLDANQPDLDTAWQRAAELSEMLDADDTTQTLEYTGRHRSVVDALSSASENLESAFGQQVKSLLEATPASRTLLEAHRILRTPLTTTRDRGDLFLRAYLDSMELDHEASEVGGEPVPTDLPTEPPELAHWPKHPAVLFAGQDESTPQDQSDAQQDAAAWFSSQGGIVRDALAAIPTEKSRLEKETNDLLASEAAEATARRTRLGLAKADTMVRSAAALLGPGPRNAVTAPALRLSQVDRHYQLLWHAHRVLNDFWGPTVSQDKRPYFANVADVYLDGAKTLERASAVLGHGDEPDLTELRNRRVAATAIGLTGEPQLKCYEAEETRGHEFQVDWKQHLPPGQAAVFITQRAANDPARLFPVLEGTSTVRRRGQEVRQGEGKVEHQLQIVRPTDDSQLTFDARVVFRGHTQSRRFTTVWPRHITTVRADYAPSPTAKVTVEGDAKRIGYIMFIVDCSASMRDDNRMARATNSLALVLDDLGNRPNYALGLRAYGRQSRFNQQLAVNLIPGAPPGLHPDLDADDVLQPMALGKGQSDAIRTSIGRLRPHGLTPLYLALKNSLEQDFGARNGRQAKGSTKHIVLITDGEDFFSGKEAFGKKPVQTLPQAVLAAWKGTDVQVHIIFMDSPGAVSPALKAIPERTGGIYKEAGEALEVAQSIREAIGLVKFSVDDSGSSRPETPQYPLGETATVTTRGRNQKVRIHGAPRGEKPEREIYLDGGESIRLIYETLLGQTPRLMFPIENPETAYTGAQVITPPGRDGQTLVIRAHYPRVHREGVDFFVTVQDISETSVGDNRTKFFTPPVEQVWCEITPVVGNIPLTKQRHYFYDVETVLNQPIPKLRFQAKDWPGGVKEAQIQMWFSFEEFTQAKRGTSVDIVDSRKAQTFTAPSLPGVTFHASGQKRSRDEPYRLTIYEQNTSLGATAILVSSDPPPDAVSHISYAFGDGGDTVKHVYEFEKEQSATIHVRPTDKFKAGNDPSIIAVPLIKRVLIVE